MQDPTQTPTDTPRLTRKPIDLARIRGTPVPAPQTAEPGMDDSWLDMPLSAPEAQMDEEPSWWTPEAIGAGLSEGFKAIPRGIANAASAAGNVVNAGARMLPGVDETTFGGMFAPISPRPLGESEGIGARLTEGIVQFGTGFALAKPVVQTLGAAGGVTSLVRSTAPGSALLSGSGGLTLVGHEVAGAAATMAAFDANSGRFADLVAKIPGMEDVLGGLTTNEDDSEFVGRLKNALDGAGLGAAFYGVVQLFKLRGSMNAVKADMKWPGLPPQEWKTGELEALQKQWADAEKINPDVVAKLRKQADDVERAFRQLDDMRVADRSPFQGQLLDDALAKSRESTVFVNRDGSESLHFQGFENKIVEEGSTKVVVPKAEIPVRPRAEVEADLAKNFADAEDVLRRRLKFDDAQVAAYLENVRKANDFSNPEQAAAKQTVDAVHAKLKARDRTRLETGTPTGWRTSRLIADLKASGSERGVRAAGDLGYTTAELQVAPTRVEVTPPRFVPLARYESPNPALVKDDVQAWVNKYGTLLDNPQTTIKLSPDGTAEIGVTLRPDQIVPSTENVIESLRKAASDMTPAQIGEAAAEITSTPKRSAPPPVEPPAPMSGGGPPESGLPVAIASDAPRLKPNQIFLGELGFDGKTADEIADVLHGEFVEGMAERGQVKLRFESKGEPFTDAVNPKRMSREELFTRELRRKGMNLEGLKGQPEEVAQTLRTLEKMYVALREAENPLLVKESVADMTARVDSELSTITGIASSFDKAAYFKLAEKVGVEDANRIGAQAKAGKEFAAGIALDLQAKAADIQARIEKNIPVPAWEKAAWAESRGLAKDALDMSSSLQNALARNLYMQRGEIRPAKGAMSRMTAVQLQRDDAALARIIMENGGEKKLNADIALIAGAGGRDLADLAHVLQLARGTSGLLGMTMEAGYASMLSGLGTPVSQMFGNLSVAAYLPLRRGLSAAAHIPFSANRAAMRAEVAESIGTYMSMFKSIPEVMRAYKTGFLSGPTLNPRGGVFDVGARARHQQITARNAGLDLESTEGLLIEAIGDLLSIPGRMLQGGDEMARVLMYRTTAEAKLTRLGLEAGLEGKALGAAVAADMDRLIYKGQALSLDQLERRAVDQVQREGYTGIHFIERKNRLVAEWQQAPWYKRLSGLSEFASEMGAEASMSKPLDPRTIGGGIQQVLNRHPVLAFSISPFHKTSVNIATFALQHFDFPAYARWVAESKFNVKGSALENTTNRFLADMRSGDPVRQAQARGRLLLGTTFASGIAAMYMGGMVTGRGPSDKKLRGQMMDAGWLPYAIKVGDTYYSYKRLEPVATIIGLVADVSQTLEEVPDDRVADVGDVAMATATALAANLTNKSYAKGLADFTNAITSPGEALENWAKGLATRFVPNVIRDVENIVDPTFSEVRGIHDAMIAKIPYLASDLEPRRNILGEPIERAKKLGEWDSGSDWPRLGRLPSAFSIVQVGQGSDALKSELASLEYAFSMPGSKRGGYDMFDIKASNGQSSYDRWLENTGKIRLGNKTLRQALEAKIASPAYQRLSADSMNGEPSARASEIGTVIQRYRRAALLQTQREIPELNQAVLGERFAQARMRR